MNEKGTGLTESPKYDFVKIKNLIENGLMHDWAISIEYAVKTHRNYTKWMKWDKTLFAIKDPDLVLEEIIACCKSNPECSMKLVCDRFSPDCRLIYCIYRKNNESSFELKNT